MTATVPDVHLVLWDEVVACREALDLLLPLVYPGALPPSGQRNYLKLAEQAVAADDARRTELARVQAMGAIWASNRLPLGQEVQG